MNRKTEVGSCKIVGLRVRPNSDLLSEIKRLAKENKIECGIVLSLVGSLRKGRLRIVFDPNKQYLVYNETTGERMEHWRVYNVADIEGPLEIVCSEGTISSDSGAHIHVVLSDGKMLYAGHLIEGNLVYTTVELFIGVLPDVISQRIFDPTTGHKELVLKAKGLS